MKFTHFNLEVNEHQWPCTVLAHNELNVSPYITSEFHKYDLMA